jgi:hypothetical protein
VSATANPVACPHCRQPIGSSAEATIASRALTVVADRERFLIEACDLRPSNGRVSACRLLAQAIENGLGGAGAFCLSDSACGSCDAPFDHRAKAAVGRKVLDVLEAERSKLEARGEKHGGPWRDVSNVISHVEHEYGVESATEPEARRLRA